MASGKNRNSRTLIYASIIFSLMLCTVGAWMTAQRAYAAGSVSEPEQYIDAEDINRSDTVYNLAGKGTSRIQKVSFGNMNWYIAGYDSAGESPVLFCADSPETGIYDWFEYKPEAEYSYAGSVLDVKMEDLFNEKLASEEKPFVKQIELSSYPSETGGGAHFYSANFCGQDLCLGKNDGVSVKKDVWAKCYSEKFWLRARKNTYAAYYAYPKAWYNRICISAIVKHALEYPERLDRYEYIPACHLNPSALLFASAAETSAENAKLDENNVMKLRFDSAKNGDGSAAGDRIKSSAEAYNGGIYVSNPTAGEYLYVQWSDESGEHVKSFNLKSGRTFFTSEDGIPEQANLCRVWIEKAGGRITYAKKAEYPSDKVFASYKDVKKYSIDYVGALPVTEKTEVLSDGWYIAKGDVTVDHSIRVSGNARLILEDGCRLYVKGESKKAAISIGDKSGAKLAIYEQENAEGILNAQGGRLAAGIGGDYQENAAHITINGGNIRATGGEHGAGIGGGFGGKSEEYVVAYAGNAHNITINEGVVVAKGGTGAAGIGGGIVGEGSAVTVNGGQITATGGNGAAGVGGGARAGGSNISIHGGEIFALGGGEQGSGIGGGYKGKCSDVTIDGGMVMAEGGKLAAGIGGGYLGTSSGIFFGTDMILKADNSYPVAEEIEYKAGEDCAEKLTTKRYVKAKKDETGAGEEVSGVFMITGYLKASSNVIKWDAVEDADGYDIYFAACGRTMKKVKSVSGLKYTRKNLKKKGAYKYCVKAYVKGTVEKEYIAESPVIHIAGSEAGYSNALKLKAGCGKICMETGDTDVPDVKITEKSSSKPVLWKNHVKSKIRYISSDRSVVTAGSNGKLRAEREGTAYVYAYAASGAYTRVEVTVE